MNTRTEAQIREFEQAVGFKLPQAYVGFLAGDFGEPGSQLPEGFQLASDHQNLEELTRQAQALLTQDGQSFTLAPNDFVFLLKEDWFLYFRCQPEDEDPAVLSYLVGEEAPQPAFQTFSGWVQKLAPASEPEVIEQDQAPPAGTVHEDFAGILTPEVQGELSRVRALFPRQLAQLEETLGWALGAFSPARANLAAGIIFGVVFLLFGSCIFFYGIYLAANEHFQMPLAARNGMSWLIWFVMSALSAGMAVIGGWLISRAKRLLGSRLVLAAHGFGWLGATKTELVDWTEIQKVEEIILRESLPLNTPLKHVLPKSKSCSLVVHTHHARQFSFSDNTICHVQVLRAVLKRVASDLQIPWALVEGSA